MVAKHLSCGLPQRSEHQWGARRTLTLWVAAAVELSILSINGVLVKYLPCGLQKHQCGGKTQHTEHQWGIRQLLAYLVGC